jgi:glutamate synthase domain-containing protein 2
VFLLSCVLALMSGGPRLVALASGALTAVGVADMVQRKRALRRNYPILAHFRFLFESIRPEIRQYFLEDDTDAKPFSRNQRSIVYQRAKVETDKRPFGTQLDVYADGYEWINHSIAPAAIPDADFRILIGGLRARAALQRQRLQYLGDELRLAVGQRDPGL